MSDSNLASLSKRLRPIEVIDEYWAKDCLSDDDIDLPKDVVIADEHDELDDEDEDENTPENAQEVWGDLGLDNFVQDLNVLNSNLTSGALNPGTATTSTSTSTSTTANPPAATVDTSAT